MAADKFQYLKSAFGEFTNTIHIDYDRESILLEIREEYLDEVFKIVHAGDDLTTDVVFAKKLKEDDIVTVVIENMIMIDIFNEPGGDS